MDFYAGARRCYANSVLRWAPLLEAPPAPCWNVCECEGIVPQDRLRNYGDFIYGRRRMSLLREVHGGDYKQYGFRAVVKANLNLSSESASPSKLLSGWKAGVAMSREGERTYRVGERIGEVEKAAVSRRLMVLGVCGVQVGLRTAWINSKTVGHGCDWHTGLMPVYLGELGAQVGLAVMMIHSQPSAPPSAVQESEEVAKSDSGTKEIEIQDLVAYELLQGPLPPLAPPSSMQFNLCAILNEVLISPTTAPQRTAQSPNCPTSFSILPPAIHARRYTPTFSASHFIPPVNEHVGSTSSVPFRLRCLKGTSSYSCERRDSLHDEPSAGRREGRIAERGEVFSTRGILRERATPERRSDKEGIYQDATPASLLPTLRRTPLLNPFSQSSLASGLKIQFRQIHAGLYAPLSLAKRRGHTRTPFLSSSLPLTFRGDGGAGPSGADSQLCTIVTRRKLRVGGAEGADSEADLDHGRKCGKAQSALGEAPSSQGPLLEVRDHERFPYVDALVRSFVGGSEGTWTVLGLSTVQWMMKFNASAVNSLRLYDNPLSVSSLAPASTLEVRGHILIRTNLRARLNLIGVPRSRRVRVGVSTDPNTPAAEECKAEAGSQWFLNVTERRTGSKTSPDPTTQANGRGFDLESESSTRRQLGASLVKVPDLDWLGTSLKRDQASLDNSTQTAVCPKPRFRLSWMGLGCDSGRRRAPNAECAWVIIGGRSHTFLWHVRITIFGLTSSSTLPATPARHRQALTSDAEH
ncbi:hypothetical protein FA13DRAFT_1714006 [Coprinellus micaceus]|uniref:Uncharacterized protein n=1 Tax=Coprinellus micaceus TaxID=71717 RepID=A0A4Y7SU34_COPMI|nr:hypothetical protein FA13DRAFT_1714006 [Coprinellus micaceus]